MDKGDTLDKAQHQSAPHRTGSSTLVDVPAIPEVSLDWRLFRGFSKDEVGAIVSAATGKTLAAGHVIFEADEPARHLFLLQTGVVKFHRVTSKGKEILFGLLISGDAFGLGTVLQRPFKYLGTAETLENCGLLVWDHASVHHLAAMYPRLTENTLSIALHYIALLASRHVNVMESTAEERLGQTLSILGVRSGRMTPDGIEISLKNEHLAALADVSPFTASRVLNEWARKKVIAKSRGRILVRVPEKLLPK
jgi:CRP-like cAMP-binding protein